MEKFNSPEVIPFTLEELSGSINERLVKVRKSLPAGHVAYHDPYMELSYEQLFECSERLAAALAARLGPALQQEQQLLALFLDADWTEIVGFLGATLAGHYYLAFDPLQGLAHPEASFREYPIRALITSTRYTEVARNLVQLSGHEIAILFVDEIPAAPMDFAKPALTLDSYHSVYLTTGSTGKPRGVLCNHAVRMHAGYQESIVFGLGPSDRITLTMPVALGMSVAASVTALLNGASIHRRREALADPAAFYRWLVDEKITTLHGSVGLIHSFASLSEEFGVIGSLRHVKTGGEALSRRDIDRLFRFMPPGGVFSSRLASNEAGAYAFFKAQAGDVWEGEFNPVGAIPSHVDVFVVDENRKPLPAGQSGELVVRSRYMAVGYFNDPAQTAARYEISRDGSGDVIYYTGDMGRVFADRSVEFLGRKDFRVKVRGYTVELEAVERALRKLEHVRDAAVTVQTLPGGNKRLVGFLVVDEGSKLSVGQMRTQLGKELSQYMIPSVLQVIDTIPRIGIGKIDRKAHPAPAPQPTQLHLPYRPPPNRPPT